MVGRTIGPLGGGDATALPSHRKSRDRRGSDLAAVAERDGAMERDYESRSVRKLEDRPSSR